MKSTLSGRTAYGLDLHGLDAVGELLPTACGSASVPRVVIAQFDSPSPKLYELDGNRVVRRLADGRHLDCNRRRGTATFYGPELAPDLLAHPYLGPVAVTFNRWAGREAFHAGAFVSGDRAWIVVGARTAGKSTLMAALAGMDVPVLADDIVVTDGAHVFTGPRCIDLREPIPGNPLSLRESRLDTRWRVALPPLPAQVDVGGWIFLHWDSSVSVRPVPVSTVLQRVAAWRALPSLFTDPARLLNLSALPAWDFGRPRAWTSLSGSVEALLDMTAGAGQLRRVS